MDGGQGLWTGLDCGLRTSCKSDRGWCLAQSVQSVQSVTAVPHHKRSERILERCVGGTGKFHRKGGEGGHDMTGGNSSWKKGAPSPVQPSQARPSPPCRHSYLRGIIVRGVNNLVETKGLHFTKR